MDQARRIEINGIQRRVLCLALLALAGAATIGPIVPAPASASAPVSQFSAERAFAHIREIANEPHPTDSPANALVRAYIVSALNAIGGNVQTQAFTFRRNNVEVHGVNLVAILSGSKTNAGAGTALALSCHYDSVPSGPGASDDGVGVATLLETARALRATPPLENDVLLLFTDGEEAGLEGARAFVNSSQWLNRIGLVLNFEARGVNGPVYMFETSSGNGPLIKGFGQAAPKPVANPLMYEVYRHMPNGTDLTVFRRAGVPGLNFAMIGDPEHYHTATDNPAHVSERSLQHAGSYALTLARHFGNVPLTNLRGGDAVYFDVEGLCFISYPENWALPFSIVTVILFLGFACFAAARHELSAGRLALAILISALPPIVVACAFKFLISPHPGFAGWPLWFGGVTATIILCVSEQKLVRRFFSWHEVALGSMFWWALLGIAVAHFLPGASYLLLFPLIFCLAGLAAPGVVNSGWIRMAFLIVAAIPALLLVTPLVRQFYVALGSAALFIPMTLLALELGLISAQLEPLIAPRLAGRSPEPRSR